MTFGENKGLLKLLNEKRNNAIIESAMDRFVERRALIVSDKDLEIINEMYELCVANPSIDSDIAKHVDYLYKNIYQKSYLNQRNGGVTK